MFDLSKIMKAAWVRYREMNRQYADWQRKRSELIAKQCSFAACLTIAWKLAKEAAKRERLARLVNSDPRAASLSNQIERLDYKRWTPENAALQSELKSRFFSLVA